MRVVLAQSLKAFEAACQNSLNEPNFASLARLCLATSARRLVSVSMSATVLYKRVNDVVRSFTRPYVIGASVSVELRIKVSSLHGLTKVDRLLTVPRGMVPGFKRATLPRGSLCDLMDALHQLHLEAGYPSTGDLRRDIGVRDAPSRTAIHNVFTGSRTPSWRLVEPLVQGMARRAGRNEKAEVERIRTLWARAARSGSMATDPGHRLSTRPNQCAGDGEVLEPLSRGIWELMPDVLDEIEAAGSGDTTGSFRIPTGFDDLDALLGGWSQGYLVVVGGRPSSGKTTLLLNFCRVASIKYRLPTMVISGEMNNREIQSRLLSAETRVPSHSIRTGQMNDDDWCV